MNTRKFATVVTVFAATAAAALLPGGRAFAANDQITVDVNGSPVSFNGAEPIEQNGSVLVPLRGVFEAMGADVNYDYTTRTIHAHKAGRNIDLPLGSTSAMVNGETQPLSEPARVVGGTTLVPLRFVAEALGGYVEWHSADNSVAIRTDSNVAEFPNPPMAHRTMRELHGRVTSVGDRRFTMQTESGRDVTVRITDATTVTRSVPDRTDRTVLFSTLRPGDLVTVDRNDEGFADTITAQFAETRGSVRSVGRLPDGTRVITLEDGTTVPLASDTRVWVGDTRVALSDVAPNDRVTIRTMPEDNQGYAVFVNPNGSAWRAHRR